jgi:hypothetical protein
MSYVRRRRRGYYDTTGGSDGEGETEKSAGSNCKLQIEKCKLGIGCGTRVLQFALCSIYCLALGFVRCAEPGFDRWLVSKDFFRAEV